MKKRMKNIVSMILALALILSIIPLFPGQASAAETEMKYTEAQYREVYQKILDATGYAFTYGICESRYPVYADRYLALLNEAVETGDASKCIEFYNGIRNGTLTEQQEADKAAAEAAEQARLAAMYDPTKIDTSGVGFTDVKPGAWYYEAVTTMAATGILKGKTPELFKPNDKITVGEWCTILWRLVGYHNAEDYVISYQGKQYPHWAAVAVSNCWHKGYTCMDCTFDQSSENSHVNRGEAATAIVRIIETNSTEELEAVLGNEGYSVRNANKEQDGLAGYLLDRQAKNGAKTWTLNMIPDWKTIQKNVEPAYVESWGTSWHNTHKWDVESIVRAYNYGVLEGKDTSGTCHPEMDITRAEACQMLFNALIFEARPIAQRGGGLVSG